MFEGCKADTLDLTHWDMSEVKSLSYMFCRNRIKDLCVNGWQLCKAEDMSYMFLRAFVSESSDFSSWKVNRVRNLTGAFQECKRVKEINLTDWEVDSMVSISRIFSLCQTLEKVCLTGWNLSPDYYIKEAIANFLRVEVIGSDYLVNKLYRDRSASLVDIANRTAGESTCIGLSPAISIIESCRREVLEEGISPLGSNRKVRGIVPSRRKHALKFYNLNSKCS